LTRGSRGAEIDGHARRAVLERAVEQADAIGALIPRLTELHQSDRLSQALVAACEAESRALRSLLALKSPTLANCDRAILHLDCLERVLMLAVDACAESCLELADRLAVLEEFEVREPHWERMSERAARLAEELAGLN
jgi:hypothetical protein